MSLTCQWACCSHGPTAATVLRYVLITCCAHIICTVHITPIKACWKILHINVFMRSCWGSDKGKTYIKIVLYLHISTSWLLFFTQERWFQTRRCLSHVLKCLENYILLNWQIWLLFQWIYLRWKTCKYRAKMLYAILILFYKMFQPHFQRGT